MHKAGRAAVVTIVAALALTGCGKRATSDSDTGSGSLCGSGGDGPKIGVAYDVGGRGDKSFNDLAAAGVKKAASALDGSCKELAASPGEADTAKAERLRTLADAGYNPIVAVGGVYSTSVPDVAKEYPKTKFAVVDGFADAGSNVTNISFTPEQGSYLVGMAAGLKTKTNKIGFIGGTKGPIIDPFAAGFVAGVKKTNPKATVTQRYLSDAPDSKAFNNVPGGRTAANALYDAGADVVFHAAGKSGDGLFEAVSKRPTGTWAIGVDSDQYLTATSAAKPHILTSSLKRVDVGVYDFLEAFSKKTVKPGYDVYDLKRDGIGYATSGGFIKDYEPQLEAAKAQIISGQIKVPNKF